jgi:hypothetical protein
VKVSVGWARPALARKFHVFERGRSLCGSWYHYGLCDDVAVYRDGDKVKVRDLCVRCHARNLANEMGIQ